MDDRRFRIYLSVIIVLFLFTLGRVLTGTNPLYDFLEPVLSRLDSVAAEISVVRTNTSELDQRAALENEVLESQNQQLREELDLATEDRLVTEVTRRDLLGFRKLVWVNVGSANGVRKGQTVLAGGVLFGNVDEVFDESALVRTILDPDFRATAKIGDHQGVLKTEWGSLIVGLVPSKQLSGQAIVSDGLDGVTSPNIAIGRIGEQISDQSEVFGSYNVVLPFSIFDTRFLEIVIDGSDR